MMSRIGSLLVLAGLILVLYSGGAYLGWIPGGYTSVPTPEALADGQRSARLARPKPSPGADRSPTAVSPSVEATSAPLAPLPVAAPPGAPVRLVLESIGIDTEVKPGGLKPTQGDQLEWETLPFVGVNYQQLGPVGAAGNPVIVGHVVTRSEGNVFRDLNRVELGAPIEVYTDRSRFRYQVDEIKLVYPEDIEVMAPTPDARLTLITCGGTFDPRKGSFSDRLIVIGTLVQGERL
jgi:LPXTG-site transpeptidase (sortase) family protein